MMKMYTNRRLLGAALAVMSAAGPAAAQSTVNLFGNVDTGLTWGRGSIADKTLVSSGGLLPSRIGFRGREDLGGGMAASFWLEMGHNSDHGGGVATNTNNQTTGGGGAGGLTFNRRSTVSLSGTWGEIRLGRDNTPQWPTIPTFDAFAGNGVGATAILVNGITGPTQVRASNAIGYFLPPNSRGIYGQVQYYAGENASNAANAKDGTGYGIRLGYSAGPINVAIATGRTRYLAGDVRQSNIGGSWDFGGVQIVGSIEDDQNGAVSARGWQFGGIVSVGAGQIKAMASRYDPQPGPRFTKLAVGYVHNLSKRTALYTTYAKVRNAEGGAFSLGGAVTAPNASSTGFDVGVNHTF